MSGTSSDGQRPNILLIMTDQQRGDCIGCDEQAPASLETPVLDQLAARGTRFRHAYSAVPACIPARASLLTGMNQWHTGLLGMGRGGGRLHDRFRHTMPGELSAAGYHTQAIGKLHFYPQRALNGFHNTILDEHHLPHDYAHWFKQQKTEAYGLMDHGLGWNSWMARPSHLPEHLHPTYWTAQQAIDWLDRRDPHKPFLLKVSFMRPHPPNDPPQVYWDMYKDASVPDPVVGDWAVPGQTFQETHNVDAWRSQRSDAEIRRARRAYYANITFIDHQVGRLLSELRRNHRAAARNTLIIFVSDHGEMLGDHHLWRKCQPYEASCRVPTIVAPPESWDVPRGQALDNVVELRDVMPTALEVAGVPIPDTVDGRSMLPLAMGETQTPWRDWLLGEHNWAYGSDDVANFYLTDGRMKYVWLPYVGTERLFDLANDPHECHDLAGDPTWKQTQQAWRERMVEVLAARNCGLVEAGKLRQLKPDAVVRSPHYQCYGCVGEAELTSSVAE